MTRFDVQQGKVVGGAVPVAPTKNPQKSHAFSIARYEAQQKRRKESLAKALLKLQYPNRQLTFVGDNCRIEHSALEGPGGLPDYLNVLCTYVDADKWEQLPQKDRYDALNLLIPKEFHTQVPGGMVYQVRFKDRNVHDEWVFLTVGHQIGRCKLVPLQMTARVF